MPAKSKAQQAFFAIAEHDPAALRGTVPKMTKGQMHDFAATPRTGLPSRVGHPHANLGKYLHPKKGR